MQSEGKLNCAFWALRLGLGATAFLAGADKFTNLLTDWEEYIAPEVRDALPVSDKTFMRMIGVVEMAVGVGVLSPGTRIASYAASAWLLLIAGNLILSEDYDVAARDVNLAIGAWTLAKLDEVRTARVEGEKEITSPQAA